MSEKDKGDKGEKSEKDQKKELKKLKESITKLKTQIKQSAEPDSNLKNYAKENNISYEFNTLKARRTLKGHTAKVYDFDFCESNSKYVVSASQDGKLIVWNFLSAHKLYVIILKSTWVLTCAYAPGGGHVACGGLDNVIYLYKLGDEEVPDTPEEFKGHEQCILKLKYIDDDRLLTTSGDSTVMLWDVSTGNSTSTFTGHGADVLCLDISSDKNTFVTGSIDRMALLWDVRSSKPSLSFSGNDSDINSIKYFPSQHAFATGDENGNVILYDVRGDRELMKYSHEKTGKVNGIAFSISGKFLFTATDCNVNVWNTLDGDLLKDSTIVLDDVVSAVGVNSTGEALVLSSWNSQLRFYA